MTLTIKPPAWRQWFGEPPDGAMVLVAAELLLDLVDRANHSPREMVTVEWGEPVPPAHLRSRRAAIYRQPIYEPVFTRHEHPKP